MSTTVTAKQAVLDVVRTSLASSGEADVQVLWGTAAAPWAGPEVVCVGDVATFRSRPRMGARTVDEQHTITLVVGCSTKTTDEMAQHKVTARAFHLLDLIDAALKADPTESLTPAARAAGIQLGQIVGDITLTETADGDPSVKDGRRAQITASVIVTARRV